MLGEHFGIAWEHFGQIFKPFGRILRFLAKHAPLIWQGKISSTVDQRLKTENKLFTRNHTH